MIGNNYCNNRPNYLEYVYGQHKLIIEEMIKVFNIKIYKSINFLTLLLIKESKEFTTDLNTFQELFLFLARYVFIVDIKSSESENLKRQNPSHGELFPQNPNGARYLDPKYSRWISVDPALGEYVPLAPVNDEAKKHNETLPGMGGLFNTVNLSLYHYAGNNPVKYTDPDGRFLIKTSNAETVALRNKKFLNSMQAYMQPMVLAKDGRIWNINLLMNNNISLSEDLDKAIDNVIKERKSPSPFTKTLIIATCSKLDNDIYKIDIVAATITETPEGTYILSNAPETVCNS